MTTGEVLLVAVLILLGIGAVFCSGYVCADKDVRKEAIKAGATKYFLVDHAMGKTEFRWKRCP